MSAKKIAPIAMIAAIYAVLTLTIYPLSYGVIQFRISEVMTVLPYLTPLAVPGLFVGALIANLFSPVGFYDVVFGSLASLIAAWLTARMPTRWLAPLPPILVNAVIVGTLLKTVSNLDVTLPAAMFYVGVGQLVICYGLGLPFLYVMERFQDRIPGARPRS